MKRFNGNRCKIGGKMQNGLIEKCKSLNLLNLLFLHKTYYFSIMVSIRCLSSPKPHMPHRAAAIVIIVYRGVRAFYRGNC